MDVAAVNTLSEMKIYPRSELLADVSMALQQFREWNSSLSKHLFLIFLQYNSNLLPAKSIHHFQAIKIDK